MASPRATLRKAGEDMLIKAGDAAVYNPNDGPAIPCRVKIIHDMGRQPSGYSGHVYGPDIKLKSLLHVTGKKPERGETFAVTPLGESTTIYRVEDTPENNGIFTTSIVKEI